MTINNSDYDSSAYFALRESMLTEDGGFAVKLKNGTGAETVKGSAVAASSDISSPGFTLQNNMYDSIGVVYESGVAASDYAWVVVSGKAQVLMDDTSTAVAGKVLVGATTDGRFSCVANPGSGLPATDKHFTECGHLIESKTKGTSVLAWAMIHFN